MFSQFFVWLRNKWILSASTTDEKLLTQLKVLWCYFRKYYFYYESNIFSSFISEHNRNTVWSKKILKYLAEIWKIIELSCHVKFNKKQESILLRVINEMKLTGRKNRFLLLVLVSHHFFRTIHGYAKLVNGILFMYILENYLEF